jgi:hypothetical protein
MRRAASALLAAAALASAVAGCGGSSPKLQRTLDSFLASPGGASWAKRFPHTPGSRPCTAQDPKLKKPVPATCSTALSLGEKKLVLATFTVSWSHGSNARTWFVFLRRDGTVDHMSREGEAKS